MVISNPSAHLTTYYMPSRLVDVFCLHNHARAKHKEDGQAYYVEQW